MILIIMLIILPYIANAETDFYEYNNISYENDFKDVMLSPVLEVSDGYIIFDNGYDNNGLLTIRKISFDGQTTIWTKTYDNYGSPNNYGKTSMILIDDDYLLVASKGIGVKKLKTSNGSTIDSLDVDGNYYYSITKFGNEYAVYYDDTIAIFDEALTIKKTITSSDANINYFLTLTSDEENLYAIARTDTGNTIYEYSIITIDSSYNITTKQITNSSSEGTWDYYGYLVYSSVLLKDDETFYFISEDLSKITCDSDSCNLTYIDGYNGTLNKLYNSGTIFNDYIILGGIDDTNNTGFIEIYDSDLTLLDTITLDASSGVKSITSTEEGFIVKGIYYSSSETTEFIKEYKLPYNIYTKTDGNGVITPSATLGKSGEEITFEVKANLGYNLSTLTITDENGNSITYTEGYTFTMPSADVTIEATFVSVIENPETKDIALLFTFILFIIGGIILIKNKKKLTWINK